MKLIERFLATINLMKKVLKVLKTDNLRIAICRMVVVPEASVQGALEDRTRVVPNPLMGVLTGAPTEGR